MLPVETGQPDYIAMPTVIGELVTHDYAISPDTLINRVVKEFDKQSELPGVLILRAGQYIGALSRRKILEQLSLPYGVELFYKRPVSSLYQEIDISYSPLPARMRVEDAVRYALERPANAKYEPLVIFYDDGRLRLLDMHILLMAQSQLLVNANQVVTQLFNVSRTFSSSLDLNTVLDSILEYIESIVPYDGAAVIFFHEERVDFVALRGFPAGMEMKNLHSSVVENDVAEIVRRTKKPLYISDVAKRSNWKDLPDLPFAKTWLGVPLVWRGEVLGMLVMIRAQPDAYNDDQIILAQTFAEQAALALKNAMLFKEVNVFTRQLEMTIEERTQNLTTAYQKLENMDRTKSEFMKAIIHELDGPIKQISGHSKYLLSLAAQENPGITAALLQVGEGIKRLHEVLERLQDVALIDANDFQIEKKSVDMSEIIRGLRDTFGPLMRERHISCHLVQIENLPAVYGDSRQLYKVFYHLIENAIRYTPNKGRITIRPSYHLVVEGQQTYGQLQIAVSDTGVGIDRADQADIFDKFYKSKPSVVAGQADIRGVAGLGLAIARKVVEAHKGKIWVESVGRDEVRMPGSTFYVALPTMQTPSSPSTLSIGVTL